jgi:glycosyltransferase involved in cell wall biosynthesis
MISTPLVSIIIPAYNREETIAECIDSALSQSYSNIEILVSTNHSTDASFDIASSFCSDPRVCVFSTTILLPPPLNWFFLIKKCKGKYTKILFSDDILLPDCIFTMVSYLESNSSVNLVFSQVLVGPSPNLATPTYRIPSYLLSENNTLPRSIWIFLLSTSFPCPVPVSPCSALFETQSVYTSLNQSTKYPLCREWIESGAGPDVNIFFDASRDSPIGYIPDALVFFRAHTGSITLGPQASKVRTGYRVSIFNEVSKMKSPISFFLIFSYYITTLLRKILLILRSYDIVK